MMVGVGNGDCGCIMKMGERVLMVLVGGRKMTGVGSGREVSEIEGGGLR